MTKMQLPDDKDLAKAVLENQAQESSRKIEMGFIGWLLFGGGCEKAGNIAGLVIILSLLMILIVTQSISMDAELRKNLCSAFISLITGALGYLFGKGDKN